MGHPEHDLLFVATQVARAAGLKNPKTGMASARRTANGKGYMQVKALVSKPDTLRPDRAHAPTWPSVWLATESATYEMLARGNAAQSQPFRDWVFQVVLPSIRKTGKFDVNASKLATRPRTRPHRTSLASSQPCMPRWLGSR